jgi:hypothetical protein
VLAPHEEQIMPQYLLSAHTHGEPREPMPEERMREVLAAVHRLEDEMRSTGTWVFGGRLHDPDTATVVQATEGSAIITDGPFVESKEHLGGFYIIAAEDLDEALTWAEKVSACVHTPIEVRPFSHGSDA